MPVEKAILKTLIYSDIFNYPLKANEIHKWLIEKKADLRQVEKGLLRLKNKSVIKSDDSYYFLNKRHNLIFRRSRREKQSEIFYRKTKIIGSLLKLIPWVKLVGVSGGLALKNAAYSDDIDLFVITARKRLFLSRILILALLSVLGQRRKKKDKGSEIAGKVCVNILLEEDRLKQRNEDIFVAHEVLQMVPLWEKDEVYAKYLQDNAWAFKFLPNWIGKSDFKDRTGNFTFGTMIFDRLENLAKSIQIRIMQKKGLEKIEEGALYFHPKDRRQQILASYRRRIDKNLAPLDN